MAQAKGDENCKLQGEERAQEAWNSEANAMVRIDSERSVLSAASQYMSRALWTRKASRFNATLFRRGNLPQPSTSDDLDEELVHQVSEGQRTVSSPLRRLIINPSNSKLFVWELAGAFLILYDFIVTPLDVFDHKADFTDTMDWVTLIYWTLNTCLCFIVGYYKAGLIVMEPGAVCCHYLKGWFIIDCAVVVPDWVLTLAYTDNANSSTKILRTLRLNRCSRMVRLLKLKKVLSTVNDRLDSEAASIMAQIVQMLFLFMLANHMIACLWYWVAAVNEDTQEMSWLKAHDIDTKSWVYQYWTSYHWSITQFTPASMNVQPQNLDERLLAVFIVIFGLIGFSYIVGSITGLLGQLRNISNDGDQQLWLLRRFLKKNAVPVALSNRIRRYVEHTLNKQKDKSSMKDVQALAVLSSRLMEELHCALNLPHMITHPIFKFLSDVSMRNMQQLVEKAVKRVQSLDCSQCFFNILLLLVLLFVVVVVVFVFDFERGTL
ncbi:unnamed protein product [Polarella glacialis]|uniref:Ion transport domain-containing protein n=1 Tax=Polarella glacialis TaxID=89957 RepID=A0A813HR34_POLGL|nr:unnamed protein product [Polarella glacialis]